MKKTFIYITIGMTILTMLAGGHIPARAQDSKIFYETYTGIIWSEFDKDDPVFSLINTEDTSSATCRQGSCDPEHKEKVKSLLQSKASREKLPPGINLVWGKPSPDGRCALYALMSKNQSQSPSSSHISSVRIKPGRGANTYDIFLEFNEEGSKLWAAMTRTNMGKDIAIVVDNTVISAPRVQDEIKSGKCMISGNFSNSEAEALKTSLGH